jgi:hypothetical protein
LRHRALGSQGITSRRAGRRGVEETNVAIRAMGAPSHKSVRGPTDNPCAQADYGELC